MRRHTLHLVEQLRPCYREIGYLLCLLVPSGSFWLLLVPSGVFAEEVESVTSGNFQEFNTGHQFSASAIRSGSKMQTNNKKKIKNRRPNVIGYAPVGCQG